MKRIISLIILIVCVMLLSSQAFAKTLEATLKVGDEIWLDRDGLYLRFDGVHVDERCPEGIDCYWSGYLLAHIEVMVDSGSMSTRSFSDVDNPTLGLSNKRVAGRYTISLDKNSILPPRVYDIANKMHKPIKEEEYQIKLIVEFE